MHAECCRVSRVSLVKRAQRLPDMQICSDSDIGDGSGVPIRGWTPPEAVAWHWDWDLCSVWESDQVKLTLRGSRVAGPAPRAPSLQVAVGRSAGGLVLQGTSEAEVRA